MTDTANWSLPDPVYQAEFYRDVLIKRLIAFIIDSILIGVLTAVFIVLTGFLGLFILPLVVAGISFVYRTASLTRHSATPGMRLVAIEMRNFRGERLDFPTAVLHTLIFTITFAMILPQIVSILSMLVTPRGQSLADLLLGTVALNRAAKP